MRIYHALVSQYIFARRRKITINLLKIYDNFPRPWSTQYANSALCTHKASFEIKKIFLFISPGLVYIYHALVSHYIFAWRRLK